MSRKRATPRVRTPKAAPVSTAAPPLPQEGPPPAEASATVDDVSAADEAAAQFFSAPPVTHSFEHPGVDAFGEADHPPKRRVADRERRRHLGRYVAGAVGLSVAICVAAAVRAATVRPAPLAVVTASAGSKRSALPLDPGNAVESTSEDPPGDLAAPRAEPPLTAVNDPAPSASSAPSVETESAPPAAATPPVASANASADEATPAERGPEAARKAKQASQRALDRGDTKRCIAEGQRAVALDETDAESWLILGAAYMQRGAYSDARRCFTSCVHDAKHGPRGECAALLR